jgi:hypothetical protein
MENIRQNMPSGLTRKQRSLLMQAYDIAEGLNADIKYEVFEDRSAYNGRWVRDSLMVEITGKTPEGYSSKTLGIAKYRFIATYGVKGGVKKASISVYRQDSSRPIRYTDHELKLLAKDFDFFHAMLEYKAKKQALESIQDSNVFDVFEDVSKEYETEECSLQLDVRAEKWEQAFYKAYMVKHGISVLDYHGQRLRQTLWSIYNLFGSAQADIEILKSVKV